MLKTKVLIIDDRQEDIELISGYLKKKGYQVNIAKNGYEGLYQFDHGHPDIVILDWNMPGLTGADICRNLKQKSATVPVIVLTVNANIQSKKEGFQAGCDDYLVKPCEAEELIVRIENLLKKNSKQTTEQPELVHYAGITLDRKSHRVTKGGRPVELSLTEYTLLEYLMDNVDRLLTRKMILEHVWGTNNPETFTNVVDVYMTYLRKKLDTPNQESLFKTVRGFGYMLEDLTIKQLALKKAA
ncbi:MAG: response regulator transcription factor [Deltaproteobacteria bacterium]|nr:response regulator transcription factor [Deltaproteobacteria bacterium]